jgi:hypothetical protein
MAKNNIQKMSLWARVTNPEDRHPFFDQVEKLLKSIEEVAGETRKLDGPEGTEDHEGKRGKGGAKREGRRGKGRRGRRERGKPRPGS